MTNINVVKLTTVHVAVYNGEVVPGNLLALIVDHTAFTDDEAKQWEVDNSAVTIIIKNTKLKNRRLSSKTFATVEEAVAEVKRVFA